MDNTELFKRLLLLKAKAQLFVDEISSLEKEIQQAGIKIPRQKKLDPRTERHLAAKEMARRTGAEARQLRKQFNLKTDPHYTRVLQYRATKDPAVFNGLKRVDA